MTFYLYSAAPIVVLLAIGALFAYVARNRRRKEKDQLRTIARSLGFAFSEPPGKNNFVRLIGGWEITGKYNGVPVRIYGKRVSGTERSSESTFVDATANCRTRFELMITRQTTLSRLGGAVLGLQDVLTGNEELDRRIVVKGVPAHVVKRVMENPRLQREVARLFEHEGLIHVDLNGTHFRRSKSFTDEHSLRPLLDSMTRTASALEEATA
jgi:hypothetical protein